MLNYKDPSLFVYIPTYERFDRLMQQIATLEAALPRGSRVYISDNASSDQRYATLRQFVNPEITVVERNSVNVGGEANIVNGFIRAVGYDYVWILSDDDLITADAVDSVLDELALTTPDLLFLSGNPPRQFGTTVLDAAGVLSILWDGLCLISRAIYRTNVFAEHAKMGTQYMLTGFPHIAVILSAVRQRRSLRTCIQEGSRYFQDVAPLPPVESDFYVPSRYGFPLLADLIDSPELRRKLLLRWVIGDGRLVIQWRRFRNARLHLSVAYLFSRDALVGLLMLGLIMDELLGRPVSRMRRFIRACRSPLVRKGN